MFSRSLRVATIGGVDVRIDTSWAVLVLLVVWVFHGSFAAAGRGTAATLAMALVTAALFFASLLAHELAHALEGLHRDVEVRGITLMIFGGVTEMGVSPRRPRDEFAISAVGPYVSLVAGASFGIAATFATVLGAPPAIAEVAGMLGWLNVLLAAFNLVPGAPLDGGRVLRAAIWVATGDRHRAVRWASYAGQGVAVLLVVWAWRLVVGSPRASVTALWAVAIGWFMWRAAAAERRQIEDQQLDGRTTAVQRAAGDPEPDR